MDVSEHASTLEPGLIAAYRAAHYRVEVEPSFTMRVGVRSPDLERLMRDRGRGGAMFITAWNPLGALLARAQNERRQGTLLQELRTAGLRSFPGVGSDARGEWPDQEDSVLVPGVDRVAACEWGRRHEQNAVLWADADAVPRLLLLR